MSSFSFPLPSLSSHLLSSYPVILLYSRKVKRRSFGEAGAQVAEVDFGDADAQSGGESEESPNPIFAAEENDGNKVIPLD